MLIGDLKNGSRRACAELLAGWQDAVPIFIEYLRPPPPELQDERTSATRAAAAAGLGLAVRTKEFRDGAVDALKGFLDGAEEQRRLAAKELLGATEYVLEKRDNELMGKLAPPLIQCVNSADPELKMAGIQGLSRYHAPGGCARLLKAAKEEKGALREAALRGIEIAATPDAVGSLLEHMTNAQDKDLADAALRGFARVREQAPTSQLVPLLQNQPENVRLEIARALASRKTDSDATKAIVRCLGDAAPAIRIEAMQALPEMRPLPEELAKLEPLISDPVEDVSLAAAKCIANLRDDTTWKLLLDAFKKDLDGKRLEACLKALGVRGAGRYVYGKPRDLRITAVPIALFDAKPQAKDLIIETLAQLTQHGRYPQRVNERRGWDVEHWKTWQANGLKRQQIAQAALDKLEDAKNKQDMKYQSQFPQLYKNCEDALATLEKCREEMCGEDPEEATAYETEEMDYSKLKFHFFKDQHL
jgi:HEAT repeat protein